MTLSPLLNAPFVVQIHAFVAMGAVALTIMIFSLRKGSPLHRVLGWTWVISMGLVAISSFWINDMRWVGPFGPIHLISIFTLYSLVEGVRAARGHDVASHRQTMRALVFGALIVAGAFTFLPGRIMFQVVSGG
jgi:uncharacterized membrane protein